MYRSADVEISFAKIALIAVLALAAFALPAFADVTYSNPFADYGTVMNVACGPFGGICAAAETINSFVFLSNYYPKIYKNTKITTGGAASPAGAAMDFGISGHGFCGYYSRFGPKPCAPNHGTYGNFVDTKNDWLKTYAPGTSYVSSFTNGNNGVNFLTMFIGPQLKQHEDVELFIYDLAVKNGHVIAPFKITYNPSNLAAGGMMWYQDPNFPTTQQMVNFTINNNNQIQFTDPVTGLGVVTVAAGFAESPIPEPGTIGLLTIGTLVGLNKARRSRWLCR